MTQSWKCRSMAPAAFWPWRTGWVWKATPESTSPLGTPECAASCAKTNCDATTSQVSDAVAESPMALAWRVKAVASALLAAARLVKVARPLLQACAVVPVRLTPPDCTEIVALPVASTSALPF